MMRGSPSTISVSFANAFRLSFVRVFARFCSARLRSFAVATRCTSAIRSSTSTRVYQRSRLPIAA